MNNNFQIGDYVKVKDGLKEPDYDSLYMDNWQGKIIHIEDDLIKVELDSTTISQLPIEYLVRLEKDGLSTEEIFLKSSDVNLTRKRSCSKEDKMLANSKLGWVILYENRAEKYLAYFKGIDTNNYVTVYTRWIDYLNEYLNFPLEVEVVETMRGGLKVGEKIKLLDLDDFDDMYGIFGIGKSNKGAVTWPICDLEVIDKKSSSYQPLKDYCIWFANQ